MTRIFTEDLCEQSMDARTQGKQVGMRPVGTEHPIGRPQVLGYPHRNRFLTHAKVHRSADETVTAGAG
jgi:hypothetical protein